MNKNKKRNLKIITNNSNIKNHQEDKNYKEISNKSIRESQDLSNVLNLTGDFEHSMEKGQVEIVKDFVRDARQNIDIKNYKKNSMNELIDSKAFSKFNCKTKMNYIYSKYEWTCIIIRESVALLIIIISFILYSKSLKSEFNLQNLVFDYYFPMNKYSLYQCVESGILSGIILFFIYLKIFFIEHLLYIFIVYTIFIYKNHGYTIGHYGFFNAFIFLIITFFIFGSLVSLNLFYRFIKRKNYIYLLVSIIIIFFFIFEGNMIQKKINHDYSCSK